MIMMMITSDHDHGSDDNNGNNNKEINDSDTENDCWKLRGCWRFFVAGNGSDGDNEEKNKWVDNKKEGQW